MADFESEETESVMTKTIRFFLSVGTCASFLPALLLVIERRRHFEAFITIFQLIAALIFSASDALKMSRFILLTQNDWHQISDILTETYICLICIHLMALRSEDVMNGLRYFAFAGCWIAKLADGWGSVTFEGIILAIYILPPQILLFQSLVTGPLRPLCPVSLPTCINSFIERKYHCDTKQIPKAMGAVLLGVLFLVIELQYDTSIKLFNAIAHCAFGASTYYLWTLIPCYDKSDDIPVFR